MKDESKISREELLELNQQLADVRHSVNNSLAVMMALAELTKRNPEANREKLVAAVLARGSNISEQINSFSKAFAEKLEIAGR